MPNLYSIRFKHFAPKDSKEGIVGYVIAHSSEDVYEFIKSEPELNGVNIYNEFEDKENGFEDGEDGFEDEGNEVDNIDEESFKERMIRLGGEMYDEDAEVNDAYYGVTHYGWKFEREIQDEGDISILMDYLNLKVL